MRVWGLWGSGETDPLVAFCEFDVEEGDECLHVIVLLDLQVKRGLEWDVCDCARLQIDLAKQARVGHDLK